MVMMMMMIMTNCVTVFLISCLPDRKINRPESGLPSAISSARSRQPLAARHQTCSSGRGRPSVGQRYLAFYGPTAGRLHFFTPVRTGISLPFTYPPRGRYKRGHAIMGSGPPFLMLIWVKKKSKILTPHGFFQAQNLFSESPGPRW